MAYVYVFFYPPPLTFALNDGEIKLKALGREFMLCGEIGVGQDQLSVVTPNIKAL